MSNRSAQAARFTGYQKFVVAVLAFLQFTIILDFMILSPLGAMLMPALKITPAQFGFVVSAYAFSAGASGLLSAGFADRYDRKKLLIFFYTGFVIGTLLCGLAPTYEFLLVARVITGLFGGVIGSIVFAITTDLFPYEMRGRVMGILQTSFSASQILGLPFGLFLASHGNWHAPFIFIVVIAALVGVVIWRYLKPINEHLKIQTEKDPLQHLISTVTTRRYLQAFGTGALLATGGFMMMPFGSAFSVNNLGISVDELPFLYMVTGLFTIVMGPLVGKASDSLGKFHVFVAGSAATILAIVIYTRLGITPLVAVIAINVFMFMGITARMIPSQALFSAIPAPASRGSFMSVNSSIQQISGGIAAVIAGLIVSEGASGKIEHFDILGNVVIGATLVTVVLMYFIQRTIPET